jgi:oxygen-dependent protoporphyrinogen oxidase
MPLGLQLMVPTRFASVAASPLFSFRTKWRIAMERFFPPRSLPADADESVADFTRRHFGPEAVERLADPLLAGVYGGGSSLLSARAVLPQYVALEAKFRSLTRGALANPRGAETEPIFSSLRGGMQQLADALGQNIAKHVRLNAAVEAIMPQGAEWSIRAAGAGGTFSHVVLAVPSFHAAKLVWPFAPDMGALLNRIRYTSSLTVALLDVQQALPPGFGFLVPRSEKKQVIACTFVHNKFNGRVPPGKQMLRAFLTSGLDASDDELSAIVLHELGEILGFKLTAAAIRISRWPNAMPQYEVGHLDRVAALEAIGALHSGLFVIGNAYKGIGIPDCVREAKTVADQISR